MENYSGDRRKAERHPDFPFIDSEGRKVKFDRRSHKERRKNERGTEVAGSILNIIN